MGASVMSPILLSATGASATAVADGSVEICKLSAAAPLAVAGNFSFSITGGGGSTSVGVGLCSPAIPVTSTSVTITEATEPWYATTAIAGLPGSSYVTSTSLTKQTATVSVSPSTTSVVYFTNQLVVGYLEICKATPAGSGLTGSYGFNITGPGYANAAAGDNLVTSTSVPVGACSTPIEVPAGTVTTTEAGTNLYVTGITATNAGGSASAFATGTNNPDLTNGTATVNIVAATDVSAQTDVTYTNSVVALKVCKTWDSAGVEPGGASTLFPFTFTTAAGAVAGPTASPTTPFMVPAGQCSQPVTYRPGTQVTISEGIVPGTKAETITATGAESVVPGSTNIAGRSISIIVGTPVTATGAPGNEAIVTFQDEVAAPGQLKICKFAGSPAPAGTSFSFSVTGVTGAVVVPLGYCVVVPGTFPYNSTVTIAEALSTGNAVSGISVAPMNVTTLIGGVATSTGELTESAVNTTAGTVSVLIGENDTTEVSYTDFDPPAGTVASGTSVTVTNPGNTGTTTAASATIATSIANGIAVVTANAPTVAASTTSSAGLNPVSVKPLTKAQWKSALAKNEKTLSNVKSSITKWTKTAARTTGKAHKAAEKRLSTLKSELRTLNNQITKDKLQIKLLK
jgi:hypothetical protein